MPIFETSATGNISRTSVKLQWNDGTEDIPPACGEDRELCTTPDVQKTILMVVLPIGAIRVDNGYHYIMVAPFSSYFHVLSLSLSLSLPLSLSLSLSLPWSLWFYIFIIHL